MCVHSHTHCDCIMADFVTTAPTRPTPVCWPPCLYLCQAFVWSAEWEHAFSLLSAPLRICVSGGECEETPLRRWKGGNGYKKAEGRKAGYLLGGCREGSPHLVAKEWLIRQAGTNERFVCPHIGLAVMTLSSSGILQIPPFAFLDCFSLTESDIILMAGLTQSLLKKLTRR